MFLLLPFCWMHCYFTCYPTSTHTIFIFIKCFYRYTTGYESSIRLLSGAHYTVIPGSSFSYSPKFGITLTKRALPRNYFINNLFSFYPSPISPLIIPFRAGKYLFAFLSLLFYGSPPENPGNFGDFHSPTPLVSVLKPTF